MNILKRNLPIFAFLGAFVLLAGLLFFQHSRLAVGNVINDFGTSDHRYQTYTYFASTTAQTDFATSTTATSTTVGTWTDSNGRIDKGYFLVEGAKRITFAFSRAWDASGNAGNTNFRVQASLVPNPTEADWQYVNQLHINIATSTKSSQSSVTISAATSTVLASVDTQFTTYYALRCIAVRTTDGAASCMASADF